LAARLCDLAVKLRGRPGTGPTIALCQAACTALFITLHMLQEGAVHLSDADWVRLMMAAGGGTPRLLPVPLAGKPAWKPERSTYCC
jgi:hypothetical protein